MGKAASFDQTVFQLISDPTEKMTIIYDLIKSGHNIIAKSLEPDTELILLEPRSIQGSELLVRFKNPEKLSALLKKTEVIVQFQVADHKYICQVPFKKSGDSIALMMEKKLFRVQRREHFRLHFPANFKATILIKEIAGIKLNQSLRLIDLSGGGCKAQGAISNFEIPADIAFDAVIKIPSREDFNLKCTIRHQGTDKQKPGERWFGIKFSHSSEKEASRIAASVMDLYREIFSRL